VLAGDIVLFHRRHSYSSALIRQGQLFRFRGADRPFAYWNHAALAISSTEVVEAAARGVRRIALRSSPNLRPQVVDSGLTPEQRAVAVAWVIQQIGKEYGFLQIGGEALACLTGRRLRWLRDPDSFICSELVADALERATGHPIPSRGSYPMPADLAKFFGVNWGAARSPQ
jgi:uncharacterized protein YycO